MNTLHCPTCGVHIDEHESGRCLDEWVITSIGIPKPIYAHHSYVHFDPFYDNTGFWYCLPIYDHGDVCEWHPIAVSASWGEAGKVIEKIKHKQIFSLYCDENNCYCEIVMAGRAYQAKASAVPLAISRTVIKTTT